MTFTVNEPKRSDELCTKSFLIKDTFAENIRHLGNDPIATAPGSDFV